MQATLLVDPNSRMNSTIEIAELKRFNINIISDLKEMLGIEYDGHPVVVLDGFVETEAGIAELVLFQHMVGLNYIFISDNQSLLEQVSRYAKTYALNTSHVGYNLVLSAINDDAEAYKPFMIKPKDKYITLSKMILDNAGMVDPVQKDMAAYLLNVAEHNKRLHQQLESLERRYDLVCGMNESKAGQIKYLSNMVDTMLRQTVEVNDALASYSFLCQKDVYAKVSLSEYKNKPHIIYFKEYGDFLHLNSFVFTIAEVMKKQYDSPVKVLWIMDKNNPLRLKFIPPYYTIFADGIFSRPVLQVSDYMCTTSGYDEIIRTICENQVGVEHLIIVDSKLVDDTVISPTNMIRYDLCRSMTKLRAYGLLDTRTIVNNEEGRELSWNHFLDYPDLSPEDRYLYLANRPVIGSVMKAVRREFNLE